MPMSASGACRLSYLFAAVCCVIGGLPNRNPVPSGAATVRKGQLVTRLQWQGKHRVKSVSYAVEDDRMPIMVWAANETTLFKAVLDYKGEGMKDCDLLTSKLDIARFEEDFNDEIKQSVPNLLTGSQMPEKFDNFLQIAETCLNVHERAMSHKAKVPGSKGKAHQRRKKRELSKWIWPGTKWCGYGNIAEDEGDYGVHHEIDQCCQEHDRCPMAITAFDTKYHYANWQMHTITHCDCDDKFFQCLANVSRTCDTAKYLGDFYFNFIQLNCFVLEYGEVCQEYSWWGGCNRKAFDHFAKVRKTPKFQL